MKIAIGNDHSAVELKEIIKEFLEEKGYEVLDLGTNSTESCDYPVYGEKVGKAVAAGEANLGIAICGTGLGISLAANKVKGIRACVCVLIFNAVTKLAKKSVIDKICLLICIVVLFLSLFSPLSPALIVVLAGMAGVLVKRTGIAGGEKK